MENVRLMNWTQKQRCEGGEVCDRCQRTLPRHGSRMD